MRKTRPEVGPHGAGRARGLSWAVACGVALAAMALLPSGCFRARFVDGRPLPAARLAQIVPGVTTKSQILEWFGAPDGFSDSSALETLLGNYEITPQDVLDLPFADALVFRFTEGSLRARYYVVYLNAQIELRSDTLVVFFDDEDRVLYYGYTRQVPEETEAPDD